ncbi:hypothetical protein RHMOL_Rhmol05G0176600 [Rhododendron molle]|uniref:Uncharacterized protein n=1 Tax=Rhododendron molle TaxID=49168 RepID=A0ACC0NQ40_RHOML|nr:hypothetical protein RHMOL_Rhmol05G0176600 [Rhododendron molle]
MNNFCVFLSGSVIYGGLGGGGDGISHMIGKRRSQIGFSNFRNLMSDLGAIHAYYNFISQSCTLNYLIAATAKDLSLMICFRPRKEKDIEFSFSSVFLKSTNQIFDYKLHPLRLIELYIWIIQHAEDVSHARDSAGELGLRGCRLQLRLGSEGVDRVKGGEGDMG